MTKGFRVQLHPDALQLARERVGREIPDQTLAEHAAALGLRLMCGDHQVVELLERLKRQEPGR